MLYTNMSSKEIAATTYTTIRPVETSRYRLRRKFNLSRDSVYNTLSFHQIQREKNGRYVRFLKVDFDRVMGVKK
jgi:hypothetical protein